MWRHWGSYIVRVESSVSQAVDNLDDIPMLYTINGFLNSKILPVWSLDDPPIIDILESVARHLLLVTGPPPICIPHRVDMFMAVHPACLPVSVAQCDLATMGYHARLTTDYGAKPSLQAGLELAGHHRIVCASLGQNAKVQGEQAQVEDGGDQGQHTNPHRKVCQKLVIRKLLIWKKPPEVLE